MAEHSGSNSWGRRLRHVGLAGLVGMAGLLVGSNAHAATTDNPNTPQVFTGNVNQSELEGRLKQAMSQMDSTAKQNGGGTKAAAGGTGGKKKKNDKETPEEAAYREKVEASVAKITEIFQEAEAKYKDEHYREAYSLFAGVILNDFDRTNKLADDARKRVEEMEELARGHLAKADEADQTRDFMKEIEELAVIQKEFPFTGANKTAGLRFTALKNRPDVAANVELAEAESLEGGGNLLKAEKAYKNLAENPRYANTLPALKAQRKLEELHKNEASRETLKTALQAQADAEAPKLMGAAKNFILNNRPAQAKEKLNLIIEKFPGTKQAADAKAELEKLP